MDYGTTEITQHALKISVFIMSKLDTIQKKRDLRRCADSVASGHAGGHQGLWASGCHGDLRIDGCVAGAAAGDVNGRCCRAETAGDDRFWGLPQHQVCTWVGAETLPLLSETANVNVLSLFEDTRLGTLLSHLLIELHGVFIKLHGHFVKKFFIYIPNTKSLPKGTSLV